MPVVEYLICAYMPVHRGKNMGVFEPFAYRDVLKLSTPFRGYLYCAYIATVGM